MLTGTYLLGNVVANSDGTLSYEPLAAQWDPTAGWEVSTPFVHADGTQTAPQALIKCDPGHYNAADGSCVECPVGSFAAGTEVRDACLLCPAGTYGPGTGMTSCVECPAGSYAATEGLIACDDCPKGASCSATTLTVNEGWYRASDLTLSLYECPVEEHCPGGNGTTCMEGSEGVLCDTCSADYFVQYDGTCGACTGDEIVFVIVVWSIILAILAAMIFKFLQYAKSASLTQFFVANRGAVAMAKILFATLQIVTAVSWQLALTFPDPFASVQAALSFVQMSLGNDSRLLPMGCLTRNYDYYGSILISTLGPMFGGVLIAAFGMLRSSGLDENAKKRVMNQHKYALILLTFCVLPTASAAIFRTYDCREIMENDETGASRSWLVADLQLECGTAQHSTFMAISGIMILLYPVVRFGFASRPRISFLSRTALLSCRASRCFGHTSSTRTKRASSRATTPCGSSTSSTRIIVRTSGISNTLRSSTLSVASCSPRCSTSSANRRCGPRSASAWRSAPL